MTRRPAYDEPFGWWGPAWQPPTPRSLSDLTAQDVLSPPAAAFLAAAVGRRASLVVAAGPSGAGKTTLLTALLEFLPPATRRVYVRGCYEPFAFLSETDPAATALLVNELSAHLPIYLWGPGVRRVLQAARGGYQLLATAHARSVAEFVYALAGSPLRVPAAEIAALDLLVLLDAWADESGVRRQVAAIVWLSTAASGAGIEARTVAQRPSRRDALRLDPETADELLRRLEADRPPHR